MPSFRERIDWLLSVLRTSLFWKAMLGLAAGFGFFIFLLNYAVMPLWTRHDAGIEVPEVRQLPAEEAVDVLERAGLRPERREQPFNPNLPADIVVDQTPLPNSSVKPGRRIYYYVNASPREMVAVPNVAGMSEGVARAELQEAGLLIGDVRMDTLRTPFEGTVTRQTPPGGSAVPQGTRVTLWLSPGLGSRQVRVPDVTGLPPDQARVVIFEAGLWVNSPDARGDTVRWQEPRAGNRLREGAEVKIHTTEPPEGWNPPPTPPREPTPDEPNEPAPPTEEPVVEPEAPPTLPEETPLPPPEPVPAPEPAPTPPEDDGGNDDDEQSGDEDDDG
jgi:serine/threonine-protein kinase